MNAEPSRYVLVGDGQSPHLLKWARTLHETGGASLILYVVSSRGLLPEFEALVPPDRRLLLHTQPNAAGGNVAWLWHVPRVARWLRAVRPDVLHAHYLSSHGTLAWLVRTVGRVPGRLVGSAWGSDVLVSPRRSLLMRILTATVLRGCELTTSDSHHMAQDMRRMGARRVSVFPFGLEALPAWPSCGPPLRDRHLHFSNRALEPWYGIDRVIEVFGAVAQADPQARLVIAHTGSQREALERQIIERQLSGRVEFVGVLTAAQQAEYYGRAQWHLSLPHSDSVSVSVIEAMAHGCIPLLSDLPANRELVDHGRTGWILGQGRAGIDSFLTARSQLLGQAEEVARLNRMWVERHGLFAPQVQGFLRDLRLI